MPVARSEPPLERPIKAIGSRCQPCYSVTSCVECKRHLPASPASPGPLDPARRPPRGGWKWLHITPQFFWITPAFAPSEKAGRRHDILVWEGRFCRFFGISGAWSEGLDTLDVCAAQALIRGSVVEIDVKWVFGWKGCFCQVL